MADKDLFYSNLWLNYNNIVNFTNWLGGYTGIWLRAMRSKVVGSI